jgi:hypothetical protein
MNQNIINEFEKLVNFIQLEIDKSKEKKNQKEIIANTFRLKQIKNTIVIIKKYPINLSLHNLNEFSLIYVPCKIEIIYIPEFAIQNRNYNYIYRSI